MQIYKKMLTIIVTQPGHAGRHYYNFADYEYRDFINTALMFYTSRTFKVLGIAKYVF